MPSVTVTRKNFEIQYRGGSTLTLNLTNAPWLTRILKVYRVSTGTSLAVQSYAGAYNGSTPGGALATLVPGYCYRIVAAVFDGSVVIPDAILVDEIAFGAAPTPQPLAVPTGLAATPTSSSTIGVSWNSVANATGYRLLVNGGTTYMPGTALSYVLSGLAAGSTSSVQVQALYSGAGNYSSSDYSSPVQATTQAAPSTNYSTQPALFVAARTASLYPAASASDYNYAFQALPLPGATLITPPAGAIKLSTISGVVSDANIAEGSTTYGTDCTTVIQQFLDQQAASATDSNPSYIDFDVRVGVTGLRYHTNQFIYQRPGCGAILRGTTSNQGTKAVWENYNARNFSVRDRNCGIYGGIINHNGFSGTNAPTQDSGFNQVHSSAGIGWNCAVRAYNVDNFHLEGVAILRQRTFAVHAINTTGMVLKNGLINAGSNGAAINSDGLHLNFTNTGFTIDNWQINSHDDKVALSVNDSLDRDVRGGNSTYYQPYYQNTTPVIENFTVTNIEFTGGVFGVRILSGANAVRNGSIKGIYGATGGYWLIMDNFWQLPNFDGQGPGYVSNLTFEDVYVDCSLSGEGYIHECGANINCNAQGLTFRNINRNLFSQSSFPSLWISGAATVVSNLTWDGYQAHDLNSNSFQNSHLLLTDAQVTGLTVSNARTSRLGSPTGNALVELTSGALSGLTLTNVQVDGLANVVKHSGGTLGFVNYTTLQHANAGGAGSFYSAASPGPTVGGTGYTGTLLLQGTFSAA